MIEGPFGDNAQGKASSVARQTIPLRRVSLTDVKVCCAYRLRDKYGRPRFKGKVSPLACVLTTI